ncbi:MAG: hypothetical protein ACKVT0_09600 [Planctomycetaceae bacterium]
MIDQNRYPSFEIAGLASAGLYALVNCAMIGPGTWPHEDSSLIAFFGGTGFLIALSALTFYFGVLHSLRYRLNWWLVSLAYGVLFAAEAFTFWIAIQASNSI